MTRTIEIFCLFSFIFLSPLLLSCSTILSKYVKFFLFLFISRLSHDTHARCCCCWPVDMMPYLARHDCTNLCWVSFGFDGTGCRWGNPKHIPAGLYFLFTRLSLNNRRICEIIREWRFEASTNFN